MPFQLLKLLFGLKDAQSMLAWTLEHTSPPSFADPSKWQSTCLSKGRSRDAPKSHQNFCNWIGGVDGCIWTFNLAPKAKAKMAFQIFSNSEWVETLGKRTAVKLKDLEAGCIWEGVTSKANNHKKTHQNTKHDNLNWASRWYDNISTACHTVFGSETILNTYQACANIFTPYLDQQQSPARDNTPSDLVRPRSDDTVPVADFGMRGFLAP